MLTTLGVTSHEVEDTVLLTTLGVTSSEDRVEDTVVLYKLGH